MDSGNKVPDKYLDIFDRYLFIPIAKTLSPIFNKLNVSPNGITTISIPFSLLAIYFLCRENYVLAGLMYVIYYILDCTDGYKARKYNQETKIGDYYDHTRDVLLAGSFVLILIWKLYAVKMYPLIAIFLVVVMLALLYVGCQEKYYRDNFPTKIHSDTLASCPKCSNTNNLNHLRFFGPGSLTMIIVVSILYLYLVKI